MRTVLICPHCESTDLYYENAMITGVVYHCKKCDYIGPIVVERDLSEEELQIIDGKDKGEEASKKKKKGIFARGRS